MPILLFLLFFRKLNFSRVLHSSASLRTCFFACIGEDSKHGPSYKERMDFFYSKGRSIKIATKKKKKKKKKPESIHNVYNAKAEKRKHKRNPNQSKLTNSLLIYIPTNQ